MFLSGQASEMIKACCFSGGAYYLEQVQIPIIECGAEGRIKNVFEAKICIFRLRKEHAIKLVVGAGARLRRGYFT